MILPSRSHYLHLIYFFCPVRIIFHQFFLSSVFRVTLCICHLSQMHFLHVFLAVCNHNLLLFSILLFLLYLPLYFFTSAYYVSSSSFLFVHFYLSIQYASPSLVCCFPLYFCIAIFLFCFPSSLPRLTCDPGCFSFFLFLLQFVSSFSSLMLFFIG